MPYYKVLRLVDGEYRSLHATGESVVKYNQTEPTKAPEWLVKAGYQLFVFESFEDIFKHVGYGGVIPIVVWEVSIGEVLTLPTFFCSLLGLHNGKIIPLVLSNIYFGWPHGTVMTNEVMFVRDVTDEYIQFKFNPT